MPEAVCLLLQYSGKCQHSTLRRLLFDCVLTETKKNREKPAKKKFVRGKKRLVIVFLLFSFLRSCSQMPHRPAVLVYMCDSAACVCVFPSRYAAALFHIPVCPLRPSQSLTCFLCHLVIPSSLASFQPITHSSKGFVLEPDTEWHSLSISLSQHVRFILEACFHRATKTPTLVHLKNVF